MQRTDEEPEFVLEQRAELQLAQMPGFQREREVNPVAFQQLQCGWCVSRFNLDEALRKTFFELSQHFRQKVLTGSRACPNSQPAMAPLAEVLETFPGVIHFSQDSFGMAEELFPRLSQDNGSAHSVQKATPHFGLQGLDRMAHSGLGQVQLPGSSRKGTRLRQRHESA
jgi:hypothetical protein